MPPSAFPEWAVGLLCPSTSLEPHLSMRLRWPLLAGLALLVACSGSSLRVGSSVLSPDEPSDDSRVHLLRLSRGEEPPRTPRERGIAKMLAHLQMAPWDRYMATLFHTRLSEEDFLPGFGPDKPSGSGGECRFKTVRVMHDDQSVLPPREVELPEFLSALRFGLEAGTSELDAPSSANEARNTRVYAAYLCGWVVRRGRIMGAPDPGGPFQLPASEGVRAQLREALDTLMDTCDLENSGGAALYAWAWNQFCSARRWGAPEGPNPSRWGSF
jgi:hypothetical protein